MSITIREIAEIAGVSRGTVDRVIHNRSGIKEDVRARVQEVIEQTGYQPNRIAKALNYVQKTKTIAVIMPQISNPFFASVKKGMDEAYANLKDFGLVLEYYFCDAANIHTILSILTYVEEKKVDAIAIRGIQNQQLCDCLNRISDTIPVLLFDSDIIGAKRLCRVGEDCEKSGRVAASLLAKSIDGKGEVAIISGFPEVTGHALRIRGFRDAICANHPDMEIVETVYSLEQSVIAYEETIRLMEQYPKLRGIFCVAGCVGDVGQALLDSQKADSIKIICYNFTPDIVAMVQKGIADFSIGLTPHNQGAIVVRTLFEYLINGVAPKQAFLQMPILIGIDENIDQLCQISE